MLNDLGHYMNREQPLDAWLFDVIAVVNDAIYEIALQLNQLLYEVDKDVC